MAGPWGRPCALGKSEWGEMSLSWHQSRKNALTSGNLAQCLSDNSFGHEFYTLSHLGKGSKKKYGEKYGLLPNPGAPLPNYDVKS